MLLSTGKVAQNERLAGELLPRAVWCSGGSLWVKGRGRVASHCLRGRATKEQRDSVTCSVHKTQNNPR